MKLGVALPSKENPWGAIEIQRGCNASLAKAQWFEVRADAVKYAKEHFGSDYAIARAWLDDSDPNVFR